MSNLDAAICSMRFELCEVKKDLKEQVTMHLYPGTRNIVVKGQLGQLDRILLGKKPFLCFEDVFLGPLVAGEDVVWGEMKKEKGGQEAKERRKCGLKVEWLKENIGDTKVGSTREPKSMSLVEFMSKQILELEEELECPVCFEVAATAPIYKCPEDHLMCM